MAKRPGGEMATRPLHFTWVADCSGSMSINGKIQSLNYAIRQAMPEMRQVASENPHAKVLVRTMAFSHGARWHDPEPSPLERYEWRDLVADPLPACSAAADVVFLLDTSGSMGDEIEAVKTSCVAFADQIIKRGAEVRLGLVGFDIGGHRGRAGRGYTVHNLEAYTLGVWPLSSPQEFKRNIQSLSLGLFGGGGCYLADPDTVSIFPHVVRCFDASESRDRILVIVSDEIGSAAGVESIVSQLSRAHVTAHVLGVPGRSGAHERIAAGTGGQFWSILRTKGTHDFTALLTTVAERIAREVTKNLADGTTSAGSDLGAALRMTAADLRVPPMSERALPPVLVLISDGLPTDDFNGGLRELLDQPWGRKAIRLAIAIGDDADEETLQRFIVHSEIRPLRANNPEALVKHIRWASTAVLSAASAPPTRAVNGAGGLNVPVPMPTFNEHADGIVGNVW